MTHWPQTLVSWGRSCIWPVQPPRPPPDSDSSRSSCYHTRGAPPEMMLEVWVLSCVLGHWPCCCRRIGNWEQAGTYDRWVATNTKYMVTHLLDTSTTTTLEDNNSTVLCLQLVPEHLQLLYVTVEWVVLRGSYNRPIFTFFLWGLIGITVQSGWILSGKIGPCAMLEAGGPAHMR